MTHQDDRTDEQRTTHRLALVSKRHSRELHAHMTHAAPEMLEALHICLTWLSAVDPRACSADMAEALPTVIGAVQSAISNATGGAV